MKTALLEIRDGDILCQLPDGTLRRCESLEEAERIMDQFEANEQFGGSAKRAGAVRNRVLAPRMARSRVG